MNVFVGLSITSNTQMLTSSIDQRLTLWDVIEEPGEITLVHRHSKFVHVADVSSMETWNFSCGSEGVMCVLAGMGIQVLTIA